MGLREDVLVYLNVKGMADLKAVEGAVMKLGYNLRLAGRDLMRMGGSLQRFGTSLMSMAASVLMSSDIAQEAFQDISYALEDAFEAAGILEPFVEFLETIAELIEANPWIAYVIAVLAVAGVIILILGKLMVLAGWMKLLIGSVLSARDAHLSWGEKIRWVTISLLGLNNQLRENLILQTQVATIQHQTLGGFLRMRQALDLTIPVEQQAAEGTELLMKDFQKLDKFTTELADSWVEQYKEQEKGTGIMGRFKGALKKTSKGVTTLSKVLGGVVGIGVGMIAFFLILQPLMSALEPVFEALGDVGESIIEPFEGMIDTLATLIEENPELAAAILGTLAAILAFGRIKETFKGLQDLLKWIQATPEHLKTLKDDLIKAKDALIKFGHKIWDAAAAAWNWIKDAGPKLITSLAGATGGFTNLALAAGAVVGAFIAAYFLGTALGNVLRTLSPPLRILAFALLAVAAAAALAWAFSTWGTALPAIIAASAAVGLLIGTFKAVFTSFQGLRKPVVIGEPTLALLHPGEEVHPERRRGGYRPEEPPMTISVDVTGAGSMEEIIKRAVESSVSQVSEQMERRYRTREY